VYLPRAGANTSGRPRPFLAGLLCALAAVVDIPAGGSLLVALGVWVAWREGWVGAVTFLAGAAGPAAVHLWLQWLITGSVLPVEMNPELFEFPGSYWATPQGRWHQPGPRWQWGLEFVIGPQGWLTVTPALVFGLAGVLRGLVDCDTRPRQAAWVVAAVVAALLGYYVWGVRRTDFSGQSFGTRHMLPILPLLWFFAVACLARLHSPYWYLLFGGLALVGVLYTVAGLKDPWSRIEQRTDMVIELVRPLVLYPWSSYGR